MIVTMIIMMIAVILTMTMIGLGGARVHADPGHVHHPESAAQVSDRCRELNSSVLLRVYIYIYIYAFGKL